ncbi:F-box protein At2g14710-like [Helianthus annuus]|uniref:F-box protein At2g14710-like n=1 Tax=Helianthus annuus TaxID=4232 RepID=UPI000B8FEED9|nr:F-box protein At2g14710-like [Helianthus annuus]
MSADIPFEIQEEIIKRVVPVKSLIRFRSVSKQWKSLIDSSEFITRHSLHPAKQHHLLLRYTVASEPKYVSIVDDDTFPHHKFSPIVSPTVKPVEIARMLDCSHGLVVIDGVIHWTPTNLITKNDMLISFDLTSEEFGEVDLPDSLAGSRSLDISKLNESLLVLDYRGVAVCDV